VSREAGQPLIPNQGKVGAVFERFVFEPEDLHVAVMVSRQDLLTAPNFFRDGFVTADLYHLIASPNS
jgi:hypothetical protein